MTRRQVNVSMWVIAFPWLAVGGYEVIIVPLVRAGLTGVAANYQGVLAAILALTFVLVGRSAKIATVVRLSLTCSASAIVCYVGTCSLRVPGFVKCEIPGPALLCSLFAAIVCYCFVFGSLAAVGWKLWRSLSFRRDQDGKPD